MVRLSAFSPNYESRSAFSPKYRGRRNTFLKNSHRQNTITDKKDIFKEILERNSRLLEEIKLNLEAYQKNKDDKKLKARAFKACEEKMKEMYENMRNINISFDEYYTDERKEMIEDINEAQKIIDVLK